MNAWRVLFAAFACLLLNGCLVTFKEPIAPGEPAPVPLLGEWERKDEWGDRQFLEVTRAGSNVYKAHLWTNSDGALKDEQTFGFTVAHYGRRWYLSAGLPKSQGANFAIAGFELTEDSQLVVYNLDSERVLQDIQQGELQGKPTAIGDAEGVLVSSSLDSVFRYLDDQANLDVFVEAARFQRSNR
ncbi:hypothetical protein [Pseudomonas sp. LRF_L74]|uniref:hypothetical protein n=1 Tax=Pseudomonas sp. LRF_L74 TaxID=3369422 RepID=UPI003F63E8DF